MTKPAKINLINIKTTLLLTCIVLFTGCASILNGKYQKVKINTSSNNAKVYIDDKLVGKGKNITTKVKRDKTVKQVKVEIPNYKDEYRALMQEKKSLLTLLGIPLIYPVVWDFGKKAYNYSKKPLAINSNIKIAPRDSTQKYIYLNKVSFDLKRDSLVIQRTTAASYEKSNKKINKYRYDKDIKIDYTIFEDEITALLKKYNYIDTVKKILKSNNNTLYIDADIKKMTLSQLSKKLYYLTYVVADLNIDWNITDIYGQSLYKTSSKIKSGEFAFSNANSDIDEVLRASIQDAANASLLKLVQSKEVAALMHKTNTVEKAQDLISIAQPQNSVNSTADAMKATVTIVTKDGHGSGFLVSNDGYIITNLHVIANSNKVGIVFNNGEKDSAVVIRKSPDADLALLKTSKTNTMAYDINKAGKYEVGQEIYVIGTPNSIELGQTLSKGIISGIRNSEGKEWLQTDVSVNFGNSGGPLITKDNGSLLGIVNAKLVGIGVEGIGFSIPIEQLTTALSLKVK